MHLVMIMVITFFIDFTKDDLDDGFNNNDFYGEWYSSFLMPKAWQPNTNSAMQSALVSTRC